MWAWYSINLAYLAKTVLFAQNTGHVLGRDDEGSGLVSDARSGPQANKGPFIPKCDLGMSQYEANKKVAYYQKSCKIGGCRLHCHSGSKNSKMEGALFLLGKTLFAIHQLNLDLLAFFTEVDLFHLQVCNEPIQIPQNELFFLQYACR